MASKLLMDGIVILYHAITNEYIFNLILFCIQLNSDITYPFRKKECMYCYLLSELDLHRIYTVLQTWLKYKYYELTTLARTHRFLL